MAERRDNVAHLRADAKRLLNSVAATEARENVRASLYEQWVMASTVEKREKIHGIAVGSETFYRALERMARSGDIADFNEAIQKEIV